MHFSDHLSQRAGNVAAAPCTRDSKIVWKGHVRPSHIVSLGKLAHTKRLDRESAQLHALKRAQRCHCSSSEKSMEETEYPIHADITSSKQGVTDTVAERSGALPLTAKELLKDTLDILFRNFWPLVIIFALSDAMMYGLHRVSHRITNEAAIRFLGGAITPQSIGNLNFLAANPEVANFETGYQYLVIVFFLVVFPLNILIRSFASTVTILYTWRKAGDPENCPDCRPTWVPPVRVMWKNLSAIWPRVWGALLRVWAVDLLVAVRVLPLQALSLLVLTLPWTLPRLLALQLATPASVVEGVEGDEAIERSRQLTKLQGVKKALLWPYLGLILVARLVTMGRAPLLSALPGRIIREVPEVPFAIYCTMLLTSVVVSRLQDVLPLAVYMKAQAREFRFS